MTLITIFKLKEIRKIKVAHSFLMCFKKMSFATLNTIEKALDKLVPSIRGYDGHS